MELPRQILIGKGVMRRLGSFVNSLKGNIKNICIVLVTRLKVEYMKNVKRLLAMHVINSIGMKHQPQN